MQIFKARVQHWAECEGILGEWQCGFRRGYRIDDHIFLLTQIIEVSQNKGEPLIAAFLDIRKAYDSICRDKLFNTLNRSMGKEWVDLLRDIYGMNTISIKMGNIQSDTFKVEKGLRQGCPLSCVLFLLYIEEVARGVFGSGAGSCIQGETGETLRVPV